jgi:hypothetical protein
MTTDRLSTAKEFMDFFESQVQIYGDEFFNNGARELLNNLRACELEKNHDAVDQFLVKCLLSTRDTPNDPPDISFVRNQLRSILGLVSAL